MTEFTAEQKAILESEGNIKINAIAGSGKTTTIIEYAKTRPSGKKILYLAFNRTVKQEAKRKFQKIGLNNVRVETAHSLAFRKIVAGSDFELTPGYKSHQIKELLDLKGYGDRHTPYILANHINKFVSYYCNSRVDNVKDLNYLDILSDTNSKNFATKFYKKIEYQSRLLLTKMKNKETPIIHDFYLKLFQLSRPQLGFDYILFDEGQDASPAMLDVFLNQNNTTKVIVGDAHQQIYGWRFAVNSLEKVDFPSYTLSKSFRFDPEIALTAEKILDWKMHLGKEREIKVFGSNPKEEINSRAVLARSNLYLLIKAIDLLFEEKSIDSVYFEGNFQSYTYADEGASLYDVLNLYNGKRRHIRDPLIRSFEDIDDLEDYIKKTEDAELGMMLEIVKKYKNELPKLIKSIKEKHVEDDEKHDADMIFSTVHRCKGMEYDEVTLVNDFINEEYIKEMLNGKDLDELSKQKAEEEINLLYVAITRTRNRLNIPKALMPQSRISLVDSPTHEEEGKTHKKSSNYKNSKESLAGNKSKVRKDELTYKPWTRMEEEELMECVKEGWKIRDLADEFGRTPGAIRSRIKKLSLNN